MKIGILSSGGDCPGINATIRGVGKTALNHFGMEVVGIHYGFQGLLNRNYTPLGDKKLSGLLNLGGTILGTSREKPFRQMLESGDNEKPKALIKNYKALGLDCLVCIGGNGTQKTAYQVSQLGLNIIGIPKTIDNDVFGTDITFGFDSAVHIATEAIDRLHSTASSHNRVMVIELMGHKAGWIALHAGMAGGADVILLPELGCDIDKVNKAILKRSKKGKPYSIVVVGEGLKLDGIAGNPASRLSKQIYAGTQIETRETVLGYVQRGGSPSAYDRNLATRLGGYATELISKGVFGQMVSIVNGQITSLPLIEVAGKTKLVTPDNDLILQGERMGISFGV
ncbi:ATP-dependent 6-phosphofructokinase 3 [Bacteroidia bacterium]|nr:ATP-dependent 6-phosphofructokinase 3 [Bacteroidia bacterium]GHV30109.1 ATP-dependent 6-phosphofructokinase 3 [Bacteroidia bacterium]